MAQIHGSGENGLSWNMVVTNMIGLRGFFYTQFAPNPGRLIVLNDGRWPNWDSVYAILRLAMTWSIFLNLDYRSLYSTPYSVLRMEYLRSSVYVLRICILYRSNSLTLEFPSLSNSITIES